MTTIVCTREMMVSDMQVTCGSLKIKSNKIERVSGVGIVSTCGSCEQGEKFIEWLKGGDEPGDIEDMEALVLCKTGILLYGSSMYPTKVENDFWAIGTGAGIAMGAMEMGATPQMAIEIAGQYDCYTGEGLQVVRWKKPK